MKKTKEPKPPLGTLTFDLSDHYQREEFEDCLKASKMKYKIDDLYTEVFRPHIKYGVSCLAGKEMSELEMEVLETIWTKAREHFDMGDD